MSIDAKEIAFRSLMVALAGQRGLAQTRHPVRKKDIKITWMGNSAFEIV